MAAPRAFNSFLMLFWRLAGDQGRVPPLAGRFLAEERRDAFSSRMDRQHLDGRAKIMRSAVDNGTAGDSARRKRFHGASWHRANSVRMRQPHTARRGPGAECPGHVDVLGFSNAEWGGDDFTCVSRDSAAIYLSEGDQGQPGTWVWIGVTDVKALHEEYKGKGATVLHPPEDFPWACEMKIGDPDGHVLRFGSDPNEGA